MPKGAIVTGLGVVIGAAVCRHMWLGSSFEAATVWEMLELLHINKLAVFSPLLGNFVPYWSSAFFSCF